MKVNKQEIWYALTQLILKKCLKYIKRIFNPNGVCNSYFLIPGQSFYGERAKLLVNIFFPALEM